MKSAHVFLDGGTAELGRACSRKRSSEDRANSPARRRFEQSSCHQDLPHEDDGLGRMHAAQPLGPANECAASEPRPSAHGTHCTDEDSKSQAFDTEHLQLSCQRGGPDTARPEVRHQLRNEPRRLRDDSSAAAQPQPGRKRTKVSHQSSHQSQQQQQQQQPLLPGLSPPHGSAAILEHLPDPLAGSNTSGVTVASWLTASLLGLPGPLLSRVLVDAGRAGGGAALSCQTLTAAWRAGISQPALAARYMVTAFGPDLAVRCLYDMPELIAQIRSGDGAGGEIEGIPGPRGAGGSAACGRTEPPGADAADDEAAAELLSAVLAASDDPAAAAACCRELLVVGASKGHTCVVVQAVHVLAANSPHHQAATAAPAASVAGESAMAAEEAAGVGEDAGWVADSAAPDGMFDGCAEALQAAAYGGHLTVVLALLKAAPLGGSPSSLTQAVVAAAEAGHLAVLLALLYTGRTGSYETPGETAPAKEWTHCVLGVGCCRADRAMLAAALLAACREGHSACAAVLLHNGARNGQGALRTAAAAGRTGCVALLLGYRAGGPGTEPLPPGAGESDDRGGAVVADGRALMSAVMGGHVGVLRQLHSAGADVGSAEAARALVAAAKASGSGGPDAAAGGAPVAATAAAAAAPTSQLEIVQLLLAHGVQPSQAALAAAAAAAATARVAGQAGAVVTALLAAGARADEDDGEALMAACTGTGVESASVAALLVMAGANPNLNRGSALVRACVCGNAAAAAVLLAAGAQPDAREGKPLLAAAWRGDDQLVSLLLSAGARPHDATVPADHPVLRLGAEAVASEGAAGPSTADCTAAPATLEALRALASSVPTDSAVPEISANGGGGSGSGSGGSKESDPGVQKPPPPSQQRLVPRIAVIGAAAAGQQPWRATVDPSECQRAEDLRSLVRDFEAPLPGISRPQSLYPVLLDSGPLVAACAAAGAGSCGNGRDSATRGTGGDGGGGARSPADYTAVARWLLEAGADANQAAGLPLRLAAASGNVDLVRVLLSGGASAGDPWPGGQALVAASRRGHVAVVRELLAATAASAAAGAAGDGDADTVGGGERPRAGVPGGAFALELAARSGHAGVVLELLAAGVPRSGLALRAAQVAGQEAALALLCPPHPQDG